MTEEVRNIQIFEKDASRLERLFGKPMKRAMHLALAKAGCEHPEGMRTYTTVAIPAEGSEAFYAGETPRTIAGFRCAACGSYVFPGPGDDGDD